MANPKYTKLQLSASTSGLPVVVAATATTGTTIHTSISGYAEEDEIWIWAANIHTADVLLTIEFGDTAAKNNIIFTVPYDSGLFLVIPGLIMNGAKLITAFAATTNVIHLSGYVHRITD